MDLSFQNRDLLNGVVVRLQLIRSKDIFCLHGNAAEYKVSLKEVVLFVHKVKPNSSCHTACPHKSLATCYSKIFVKAC